MAKSSSGNQGRGYASSIRRICSNITANGKITLVDCSASYTSTSRPQLLIGFMLLFPHVILHEAAVTFLGLGLSPHEPAIGIILSESMKYLSSGMWWLAFFPGLCLLIIVRAFDHIGENLRLLMDPTRSHE